MNSCGLPFPSPPPNKSFIRYTNRVYAILQKPRPSLGQEVTGARSWFELIRTSERFLSEKSKERKGRETGEETKKESKIEKDAELCNSKYSQIVCRMKMRRDLTSAIFSLSLSLFHSHTLNAYLHTELNLNQTG
ncbi:hypothetical protein PUN28_015042 [Cardiocondyla obscurior]|uniref:Uncharacterized protein n=1 Tax=Cardiocondyla obscurior TaxID=286306 RepID=A0AAW2EWS1_9HYME